MDKKTIPCPLCKASNIEVFYEHQAAVTICFYKCLNCEMVFKSTESHISTENEKKRYEQHNNDTNDERYLNYLNQLWRCRPEGEYNKILDYGCGPSKGLESLHPDSRIDSYDPFFYPIELRPTDYDLVFCCEVVEHFNDPYESWGHLISTLSIGGILLVRTEAYEKENFSNWYYKDDPTHVCFYNTTTFEWVADKFKLKLLGSEDGNKFIFKKL